MRGNREGDVSYTIDVYKKEEGAENRTSEETSREEEVEPLTTTVWDRLK